MDPSLSPATDRPIAQSPYRPISLNVSSSRVSISPSRACGMPSGGSIRRQLAVGSDAASGASWRRKLLDANQFGANRGSGGLPGGVEREPSEPSVQRTSHDDCDEPGLDHPDRQPPCEAVGSAINAIEQSVWKRHDLHQPGALAPPVRHVQSPSWPENPGYFRQSPASAPHIQMVKEQGGEDDVEACARVRQLPGQALVEPDPEPRAVRLVSGAAEHIGVAVETHHLRGRHPLLQQDGQGPGSAAQVENRLSWLDRCLIEQPAPEGVLPAAETQQTIIQWGEPSESEGRNIPSSGFDLALAPGRMAGRTATGLPPCRLSGHGAHHGVQGQSPPGVQLMGTTHPDPSPRPLPGYPALGHAP